MDEQTKQTVDINGQAIPLEALIESYTQKRHEKNRRKKHFANAGKRRSSNPIKPN